MKIPCNACDNWIIYVIETTNEKGVPIETPS